MIEIRSGKAQTLPDSNGTVFLLGSGGRAQLTGTLNFNKPSRRSGGGGGEGGVTEAEVKTIVSNSLAPVREELERKADISDVSNPNLLDNPDFRINQRGRSEYTASGYTVDRWRTHGRGKVTVLEDGVEICRSGGDLSFRQYVEKMDLNRPHTFSVEIDGELCCVTAMPDLSMHSLKDGIVVGFGPDASFSGNLIAPPINS